MVTTHCHTTNPPAQPSDEKEEELRHIAYQAENYKLGLNVGRCMKRVIPSSCHSVKKSEIKHAMASREEFVSYFERLSAEILAELPTTYEMPAGAVRWIKEVCRYRNHCRGG